MVSTASFLKSLEQQRHGQNPGLVFDRWAGCVAAALDNGIHPGLPSHLRDRNERDYAAGLDAQARDTRRDRKDCEAGFAELLARLVSALDGRPHDFLGEVCADLGRLDKKYSGQVFTPHHVARLSAELTVGSDLPSRRPVTVQEPACGAGAMAIAAAEVLAGRGVSPRLGLVIDCTDIDRLCFNMCFIQLACLGISARVTWGDTLRATRWTTRWTTREASMLWVTAAAREADPEPARKPIPSVDPVLAGRLF